MAFMDFFASQLIPGLVSVIAMLFTPEQPVRVNARVVLDDVSAKGGLPKIVARRFVKRRLSQLAFCVEKDRLGNRHLGPHAHLQAFVDVSADGDVSQAAVAGMDDEADACTRGVFERIQFPKAATATAVTVSISFNLESP